MIRLTKKDLMEQIKIMRNDLIGGYIDSVVDNCGTYKRINETEVFFWGITKKAYDYMVELKDCTLLRTPAFKKEVARYIAGDFKIIGNIKIIVNGIFGTAEVLVDIEEMETGKIIKDVCYLWDNNCDYSMHKELEKQYPDAEKEFNKKKIIKDVCALSSGTVGTLLREVGYDGDVTYTMVDEVINDCVAFLKDTDKKYDCWQDAWNDFVKGLELNQKEVTPEPEKKSGFEVRIIKIESGEVIEVMNAPNARMAGKIFGGVLMQLNKEDYYVDIVDLKKESEMLEEIVERTETTEKVVEKMEEEEMNTINKNALNNRMAKLGNFIKENRNVEDIEKKIFELFPKAMEVDVFGEDKEVIYFLVGQDYVGKAPSKKEMKDIDYKFDSIDKVYGLSVHIEVDTEKIKIDASVGIDYTTKYYHREYTDYTIKEIEIELELTMEVAKEIVELTRERHTEKSISATYAWEKIKGLTQRETTDEVMDLLMGELTYYAQKEKEEKEIENREEIEVGICRIDLEVQKGILWREKAEEKIERLYRYASTPELQELVDLAIKYIAVRKEDNIRVPQKLQEILNRRYKKVVNRAVEKVEEKITGQETPEQVQTILSRAFKNISIINNGQLGYDIQSKIVECYRGEVNDAPADVVQILRGGEVYIGVEKINATNETIIYVKTKVEYLDTEGEFNTYIDYLYYREIKNNPDTEKEPCLDSQEESGDAPEPEKNNLDKMIKEHIYEVIDLYTNKNNGVGYKYEKTVATKKQNGYELTSQFKDNLTGMDVYLGHSGNMILTPNSEKKFLTDTVRGMLSNSKSVNETVDEIKEKIKRKFEYTYSKTETVIEPDETKVYVLVSPEDTEVFWRYEDAYKKCWC